MSQRPPRVTSRLYTWRTPAGESIPGIGFFRGPNLYAFLGQQQAFAMADRLVDLAEQLNEQDDDS